MARSFYKSFLTLALLLGTSGASAQTLTASDLTNSAPDGPCSEVDSGAFVASPPDVTRESGKVYLKAGKYRPTLDGTAWRFSKFKEFNDFDNTYSGELLIQVIRLGTFGGETVVSQWSRAHDQHAYGQGVPDAEFKAFTITAGNEGDYILRITAKTSTCARAGIKNIRVDFVKEVISMVIQAL